MKISWDLAREQFPFLPQRLAVLLLLSLTAAGPKVSTASVHPQNKTRQISISPPLQFAQLYLCVGPALVADTSASIQYAPIDLKQTQDLSCLTLSHSL